MSGIFGILGLNDTDRVFLATVGQQVVYDATMELLNRYNADLTRAMSIFVEGDTETHTERYKLPGGGRLQRRAPGAAAGATKAYGSWDTAYPLEDFGAQIAGDDVAMAYMTMQEYDRHLDTIMIQDVNTVRFEMLLKLFKNTNTTFVDSLWGSLTVVPLANSDTVTYPPVLGSETEATDSHYLQSGYAATAISDSNNPYVTIRAELEEHFGASTGGDNIVVLINQAETPETEDLTDFDAVEDRFVRSGANADVPFGLPDVPGRIVGRTNGVWVAEWRWMPANYMFGIHLDAPRPLKMRVDPADTGLPRGLAMVADDDRYPIQSAHWRHRFGVGCANRLNGVVMELGTDGSYGIPTAYA